MLEQKKESQEHDEWKIKAEVYSSRHIVKAVKAMTTLPA